MRRTLLLTVLVTLALLATGCLGKGETDPPPASEGPSQEPVATASASATGASATSGSTNASASANASATGNSSANANMPADPGNCMRGMDMEGCTAAQADAYFDAMKANAPPLDKELPPIVIALDPQGANPSGAFTLDAGTMRLLIEYRLTSLGPGPYAALGPDGTGDLSLNFVGPDGTESIAIEGLSVGIDPANPLSKKSTATIDMPTIGDWTLTLDGQGTNTQIEILMIERFYM